MPHQSPISHDDCIVMLGSCFTDSVGQRLADDGFDVAHNPMGPLFNPASIARCIQRALSRTPYAMADLTEDADGCWHCLDYAWRYNSHDAEALLERVNADVASLADAIERADVLIATWGTAWVFDIKARGCVAGNCHKLPAQQFARRRMSVDEVTSLWRNVLAKLPKKTRTILTVSPVRHLADGLHGNETSKATLLLAAEAVCEGADMCSYFPSYEMLIDDLRDYRYYAADMLHPSETAVDYVYEHFATTYFTAATAAKAKEARTEAKRRAHRQILPDT